jgi:uncharacterized damage-inducible protein DinB
MKKQVLILLAVITISSASYSQNDKSMISPAQENDYYYQIPDYPETYSSENVAARLVDGLGFRFYWATEGLRQEDLEYKPSEEGRTTAETIDHIMGLTSTIVHATLGKVNPSIDRTGMTAADKRNAALENIRTASENLKDASEGDIEQMMVIFQRGDGTIEYPFWNMINGPISDAIYHTGQVVTFRRTSGNPTNPNISVLQGRKRN